MSESLPFSSKPDVMGMYEILMPIGTGGMATVYLARREVAPGALRFFALKVMHPHFRTHEAATSMLLHEARVAAHIAHPNVVSIVEAGMSGQDVFLVMDYVEGDTLSSLIRAALKAEEKLPVRVTGRIVVEAFAALHAAHEARGAEGEKLGIMHRDFTPQNILVGADGITRLTDFGIAKVLGEPSVTATGVLKGKASYLAPEQIRGERADQRSDLWSAAVVAWEAFACQRLFPAGENEAAMLLEIATGGPIPRLASVRPEVPPALDDAIASRLDRDPSKRPSSVRDLAEAIEAALRPEGLASHAEVAAWVGHAVGAALEERRASIRSRTAERRAPAPRVERQAAVTAETVSAPSHASEGGAARSVGVARTTHRPWWLAAVAIGGFAGVLGVWRVARGPDDSRSPNAPGEAAPSASSEASSPSAEPPVEIAPAPPSATSSAAGHLVVRADAPIASIAVSGGQRVVLGAPQSTFDLALPPTAATERVLEVIAADGRRARVTVGVGAGSVQVQFPPPVRGPQASPARTTNDPGLAPSRLGAGK